MYNGEAIVNAADGSVLNAAYFAPEEIGLIRETLEAAGISPLVYSHDGGHTDDERVTYVPGKISHGMAHYLNTRKGDKRLRTAAPELSALATETMTARCSALPERVLQWEMPLQG